MSRAQEYNLSSALRGDPAGGRRRFTDDQLKALGRVLQGGNSAYACLWLLDHYKIKVHVYQSIKAADVFVPDNVTVEDANTAFAEVMLQYG